MAIRKTVGRVSVFGWLDNLSIWSSLPYPVKGAVLRGLKAGLSVLVAALITAATAGTLFPVAWGPVVIGMIVMGLQGIDKYIREWNIAEQDNTDNSDVPTSDPVPTEPPVTPDDTTIPDDTIPGTDDNTDPITDDLPPVEDTDFPTDV